MNMRILLKNLVMKVHYNDAYDHCRGGEKGKRYFDRDVVAKVIAEVVWR